MAHAPVNEDLVKERKKCTFDVQELIHLVDDGVENTKERKRIEELVLSVDELKDDVPEEYLSHKERYNNSIRKSTILFKILREHVWDDMSLDIFVPSNKFKVILAVNKDVSPLLLHLAMFLPTIASQASDEQLAKWLPKSWMMQIIGTYAQTELGHGTFLRGLETTATYDPKTEEFVIHSPTLTSFKWWPGGLAQTANHCIVVAQLYTNGKCYGVHPFIVQIRDTETHMPMPGIKVGEIGPKMGFQTANNGFLGFNNFRIPRTNLLMKNAQVLKLWKARLVIWTRSVILMITSMKECLMLVKPMSWQRDIQSSLRTERVADGTYTKSKNDKLAYGTMVFVRVIIVTDLAYDLARAATIAVRYSAVRHQSQPKPNGPEPQIIDYVTQQHKLFIGIATSYAFRLTGKWLWGTYSEVIKDVGNGNMEQLPDLHALACCLKAVSSRDASARVDELRQACGGHGYMTSSNLPVIGGTVAATITYEGEYTVLMLQTARYLVKAWKKAIRGSALNPNVEYLLLSLNKNTNRWENNPDGIIRGFKDVATGKIKAACEAFAAYQKTGMDIEDAWNMASVQLVNASEAHCRTILCEVSWREILRISASVSPSLAQVLHQLIELYLIYWTLEKKGDLLLYSRISKDDITRLQQRYEELLANLRPNAVGIVDGFDIRDEILCSTLGAYDGLVYERLMEEALKSPLNAEPVPSSFHKYLKPMMNSKL